MQLKTDIQPEAIVYDINFERHNISEFIHSVRIVKDVDMAVSRMTMILNPSSSKKLKTPVTHNKIIAYIKTILRLHQIITVKIYDKSSKHNFLGFIDHVTESVVKDNNSTSRSIVINCSKLLPKLLVRDNIVNSPVLAVHPKIKEEFPNRTQFFGWMRGLNESGVSPFVGKPEEAVKWILDNVVATNTNVGNEKAPKTFFDSKKKDYQGKSLLDFTFLEGEYLFNPNLARFSGPIINYIYQCIDRQFYEVFFDTTTGEDGLAYNKMVIRPKPFSYKDYDNPIQGNVSNWLYFDDLEEYKIDSSEIIRENLGISDYELKNFFTMNFANSLIGSASSYLGKFGLQFPIVNMDSIKRYGLRDLTMTSNLINTDSIIQKYNEGVKENGKKFKSIDELTSTEENNNLTYLLSKREKGVEWFGFPFFESGQITIPGHNDITIGKVLNYTDKLYKVQDEDKIIEGVKYYIKGITEDFVYGSHYTKTINVVRGAPEGVVPRYFNLYRSKYLSIDNLEAAKEEVDNKAVEDETIYNNRAEAKSKIFEVKKAW